MGNEKIFMEDLEKLKKEMELELDYALRPGSLEDYESIGANEAAAKAVSVILEHLEPIID